MMYFSKKEMACNCCGKTKENQVLIEMINKARRLAGIPFIVTSWYRCEKHNSDIGSSITSSHIKGKAIDISFKNSADLFKIIKGLIDAGFVRIGINHDKKFVHCDIDLEKIQSVIFTY